MPGPNGEPIDELTPQAITVQHGASTPFTFDFLVGAVTIPAKDDDPDLAQRPGHLGKQPTTFSVNPPVLVRAGQRVVVTGQGRVQVIP